MILAEEKEQENKQYQEQEQDIGKKEVTHKFNIALSLPIYDVIKSSIKISSLQASLSLHHQEITTPPPEYFFPTLILFI